MQNAKDTFYLTLRDRLAALNPARTLVLRGTFRPGSLVEENELPAAGMAPDVFCLRWIGLKLIHEGPLPQLVMQCEVQYCTDGSPGSAGMDRGRLLAAMDAELLSAVLASPQNAMKLNFATSASTGQPTTRIFWGDVSFGACVAKGERLTRSATIEVFALQEVGEL